jgi:predicted MFS family arabinose efflux permease
MMSDMALSYTQLGIMEGFTSIISGFAQMLWSLLSRHAARGLLLGMGNIMMSTGIFVMGLAKGFTQLIGGSIIKGGGQAAQHPVGTSIITSKFSPQKASRALSVHYGMGYIGNIVSPIILSSIAIVMGWRQATYILAVVPLVAGLTLLYYLRGEESAEKSILDTDKGNLWEDVKSVFRVRSAMLIVAGEAFAVGGTGMGVIITYTPLFLRRGLNVESLETSVVYSIAVIGGVVGTLVMGHLAQRLGNLKTALPIMGAGPLLILLLTLYDSFSFLLVVHLFAVGATSFSFSSLLQAHLASISTQRQRDIMFGLYFTIAHGLSSVWTAVTGLLIDTYGSFNPAWILRAILGLIAFCLVLLASLQQKAEPSP